MRMLGLVLRSAVPSKHAEHTRTHQELMRTLSLRSGTDAFSEHMNQELICTLSICFSFTRMLSISIKVPHLKEASKHADHAHKELMRARSVRVRS
jgi:hypothetical protein